MVQLYRECFGGEQPISEFLFTEFMYSEENHGRDQNTELMSCHCLVLLALDFKLITAESRSAISFLRAGAYDDPGRSLRS